MMDLSDDTSSFSAALAQDERYAARIAPPARGKLFGRLRVLTASDAATAPQRKYILAGLIAPNELSVWWGQPKCGKSFLLLRVAFGLANGHGMWGRRAKPCRVLYVAAEGEGGFAARLLALRAEVGDAGNAFCYIAQRTMVGPPSDDLASLIDAARDMRADLIVIDTLARTFGHGDENGAKDMGGFVASLDVLREATGAHVAVIHHGTKEGSTSRGSGALLGAADLIVKVSKGAQGGSNHATVEEAKDDVGGLTLPFALRVVETVKDEDGEPARTCIAEEAEGRTRAGRALPKMPAKAFSHLTDLLIREGQPLPHGEGWPKAELRGIPESRWREECDILHLSMAEKPEDRARVYRHAAGILRDRGDVVMREGWVWIAKGGAGDVGRISADRMHRTGGADASARATERFGSGRADHRG